ncbi:MAG: bifunctional demethylmenaquinone methyltransferase/2-methoxy-6-polyprenyl-1,4-benzoquinol methylase UbiE [Phycisphaeraceae bacterium]|nr:bifunctional demethylmenaquinone methyltransferase/2-methoxy-6-polyprenyl-1,4-benzoquinol methylase UbiE [Phycisphaeraceae bacterium]
MPAPADTSWDRATLSDPHAQADKAQRVRDMFGAIAPRYDLNNRLHSLGRDQAWRRAAVRAAAIAPGDRVLDVACGTGDLTAAIARREPAEVIGVDFTQEMLDHAEAKRVRLPEPAASRIRYQRADAMDLPFQDASFDAVTIAFGLRNVADPSRAIVECVRVLRPAGRLVILEFTTPRFPPVRWANALYSGWIMPRTASLIARDRSGAYRYLPRSVSTFLTTEQVRQAMRDAGLEQVGSRSLTLGICACYRGVAQN